MGEWGPGGRCEYGVVVLIGVICGGSERYECFYGFDVVRDDNGSGYDDIIASHVYGWHDDDKQAYEQRAYTTQLSCGRLADKLVKWHSSQVILSVKF